MKAISEYAVPMLQDYMYCNNCKRDVNPVGVIREIHVTMYCSKCGSYIKHASRDEVNRLKITTVPCYIETRLKVITMLAEAERKCMNKLYKGEI